jgi:isoquinoline 1-oxidoreductase
MNQRAETNMDIEAERYELREELPYRFELDRRDFLKSLGGGLLVLYLLDSADAQESGQVRRRGFGRGGGQGVPEDIAAWLHIGEDSQITVYTGKAEVGQNIRTSLAQVVAEELNSPLGSIKMVMADTQHTPFDMGTFGSRTTPDMSRRLRRTAATARELLIDVAAETWKAERSELVAADGRVTNTKTKESLEFGKLAKDRKLSKAISDSTPMCSPEQWKIAGHSAAKVDGRAFVTGKHEYASDIRLPGMLHGKVLRAPTFGATLTSVDTSKAQEMPDVIVVHDGDFVGVAAPSQSQAAKALAAIHAEWKPGPPISAKTLFQDLKRPAPQERGGGGGGGGRGNAGQQTGSIAEGLNSADVRLKETYTVAYIAHAPLEPRAAVAKWENGKLTVWTGGQRPFGVRGDLAGAFRLADDAVRVIVPDTGAGYGGKHTSDAAIEAARLAKAAGRSVKRVWTREEEMTWAYFRPAGVIEISSGARRDGTLTAWEFHNYNSGGSGIRSPYNAANQHTAFHQGHSPLRQGSYRALASTANTFARESHMDELAHAAGLSPLEFRLKNLSDPRVRAVLEAAALAFGWSKYQRRDHHGIGIAAGTDKGGYIATCAEVAIDPSSGRVQVVRAVSAFECGAIINPDHLKNQVEGALIMGLGGALFEEIAYDGGRILNPRFSRYRVPRFRDTPELSVVLLDRKDLPSAGAGETPIIAIAPAVGNAIFHATGIRLRSLPMAPRGVKV